MLKLADNRSYLYQWDTNVKVIVDDETIEVVEFQLLSSSSIMSVKVEDGLAEIPNILLQNGRDIAAYASRIKDGQWTKELSVFKVKRRTKPTDYVYTETEIKSFEELEDRIETIEKYGAKITVDDELSEESDNPIQNKTVAKKVNEILEEIPKNVSQLTNDSGFLTTIPDEYITETELDAKGYLTQHQDLSEYALKNEIPTNTSQLTNDSDFQSKDQVKASIDEALKEMSNQDHNHDDVYAHKNHIHSWIELTDKPFGEISSEIFSWSGIVTKSDDGWSRSLTADDVLIDSSLLTKGETYVLKINGLTKEAMYESIYMNDVLGFPNVTFDNGYTIDYQIQPAQPDYGRLVVNNYDLWTDHSIAPDSLDITFTIGVPAVKQIDEKYIPDTIQRTENILEHHTWENLPDKPFGEVDNVLYSTDVQFKIGYSEPEALLNIFDPSLYELGEYYTVKVNEHTIVTKWVAIYRDVYGIDAYSENGDRFYMYTNSNGTAVFRFIKNEWRENAELMPETYDAHISISTPGLLKQIDEKYIPDTIARTEYVDTAISQRTQVQIITWGDDD